MMEKNKRKIHANPRCSVTKLAEYVTQQSSPARRFEIVRGQKIPLTFQTVTYTPATKQVVDYLVGGCDDADLITAMSDFADAANGAIKDFDKRQAECCLHAIRDFRRIADQLDLSGCEVMPGSQTMSIDVAGVTVSLRPEIMLVSKDKHGNRKVGFVKLYFSKTHRLDDKAAGIISALLIDKAKDLDSSISYEDVKVVDVFGQRVYQAPKHIKKLLNEAKAACREIAMYWASVA